MTATRLSEMVQAVLAPNPGPLTLEGTNTYVVGDERNAIVIDPGPNEPTHLDAIAGCVGGRNVLGVFLTHWHGDHSESVREAAKMLDAPVGSWSPLMSEEIPLHDGERAGGDGVYLTAVHTPGHSSDHLCFWLEEERTLFSGDHVLGRGSSVVAHPDGNMRAYLSSLEKLRAYPAERILPGHGPVVAEPRAKIDEYYAHRLDRERQVVEALPGTPEELVAKIYVDVPEPMHRFAAMSVRAHLEKLAADGVAAADADERWARVRGG